MKYSTMIPTIIGFAYGVNPMENTVNDTIITPIDINNLFTQSQQINQVTFFHSDIGNIHLNLTNGNNLNNNHHVMEDETDTSINNNTKNKLSDPAPRISTVPQLAEDSNHSLVHETKRFPTVLKQTTASPKVYSTVNTLPLNSTPTVGPYNNKFQSQHFAKPPFPKQLKEGEPKQQQHNPSTTNVPVPSLETKVNNRYGVNRRQEEQPPLYKFLYSSYAFFNQLNEFGVYILSCLSSVNDQFLHQQLVVLLFCAVFCLHSATKYKFRNHDDDSTVSQQLSSQPDEEDTTINRLPTIEETKALEWVMLRTKQHPFLKAREILFSDDESSPSDENDGLQWLCGLADTYQKMNSVQQQHLLNAALFNTFEEDQDQKTIEWLKQTKRNSINKRLVSLEYSLVVPNSRVLMEDKKRKGSIPLESCNNAETQWLSNFACALQGFDNIVQQEHLVNAAIPSNTLDASMVANGRWKHNTPFDAVDTRSIQESQSFESNESNEQTPWWFDVELPSNDYESCSDMEDETSTDTDDETSRVEGENQVDRANNTESTSPEINIIGLKTYCEDLLVRGFPVDFENTE